MRPRRFMPMPQRLRAALAARPWPGRASLALAGLSPLALAAALVPTAPAAVSAAPAVPRVVEVPSRPAFIKPPGGSERPARSG